MGWAITGTLLVLVGVASEAVLGSFAHFFDWGWPRQRYPRGGNHVRVIGGRILLLVGLAVIVAGCFYELLG